MRIRITFGGGVCYQKLTQTNGTCGFRQYAFVGKTGLPASPFRTDSDS